MNINKLESYVSRYFVPIIQKLGREIVEKDFDFFFTVNTYSACKRDSTLGKTMDNVKRDLRQSLRKEISNKFDEFQKTNCLERNTFYLISLPIFYDLLVDNFEILIPYIDDFINQVWIEKGFELRDKGKIDLYENAIRENEVTK